MVIIRSTKDFDELSDQLVDSWVTNPLFGFEADALLSHLRTYGKGFEVTLKTIENKTRDWFPNIDLNLIELANAGYITFEFVEGDEN